MLRLLQFRLEKVISGNANKGGSAGGIMNKTRQDRVKNNKGEMAGDFSKKRPTLLICLNTLHVGGVFWLPAAFRFVRGEVKIVISKIINYHVLGDSPSDCVQDVEWKGNVLFKVGPGSVLVTSSSNVEAEFVCININTDKLTGVVFFNLINHPTDAFA